MEPADSMAFYPKTRAGAYDIAKLSRASYNKNKGFCGGQTISPSSEPVLKREPGRSEEIA